MHIEEFVKIVGQLQGVVYSLQCENRELKQSLNIMEEILHSYLPIIEDRDEHKNT